MKNNYNTCANMEDIELNIFYDAGVSRMDFEDNFQIIEHSSYHDSSSYLFYTGYDLADAPCYVSDCYDFSNCTEKDFRAFCIEQSPDNVSFRDLVETKNYHGDWKDCAFNFMDEDGLTYAMRNGFPDITNAIGLYECVSISGYSQGDYSTVLYKVEPDSFLEDTSKAISVFTNLVFDTPIYARAEIDGEELYLEEAFSDSYSYDKDELTEWINKQDISSKAKEWIIENLPEYPDYL